MAGELMNGREPAELHEVGKRKMRESRAETSKIKDAHQATIPQDNLLFAR